MIDLIASYCSHKGDYRNRVSIRHFDLGLYQGTWFDIPDCTQPKLDHASFPKCLLLYFIEMKKRGKAVLSLDVYDVMFTHNDALPTCG